MPKTVILGTARTPIGKMGGALASVDAIELGGLAAGCRRRVQAVRRALEDAVGRVTAEPVWATRSSPPFDAAGMDGIAVRAADTVGAAESRPVLVEPDAYAAVDTGDPLPDGFDAVVMREHVHYDEQRRAELRAAVAPYQ